MTREESPSKGAVKIQLMSLYGAFGDSTRKRFCMHPKGNAKARNTSDDPFAVGKFTSK